MNVVQRIVKNTAVSLFARAAGYIFPFFYMMYAARYLGAAGFGILSFALAFTAIFGILADLGLHPLTVREIARDKSLTSKYLANISLMKIILVAITFGLIVLTINLLGYPKQTIKVVYVVAISVLLGAFTQMFNSVFHAYERMEYSSLGGIIHSALLFSGVMFAVKYGFSVTGFASLYCVAGAITLGYSFAVLRWKFSDAALGWTPRKMEMDWTFWQSTVKEALPFGLGLTFAVTFHWVDSVMLSLMKGDAVVGWYNAAYRMMLAPLFIPQALIAAVFPVMSRFHTSSQRSLMLSFKNSFRYMAMMGVPIGLGTTLLARRLILLIFGAEYANSIIPLQILIWSSALIFMNVTFGNLFNSLNKQAIGTKITGIFLMFNIVLNLILIPKYSLIGASIATVSAEFLSFALGLTWAGKLGYGIPNKELASIVAKVLIASGLMGVFVMYFHNLTLLVLVPSAVLLYFMVLYAVRGINDEDINLLRRTVRRKYNDTEME